MQRSAVKHGVKELFNATLRPFGYEVVPSSALFDWQRSVRRGPAFVRLELPQGAAEYLQPANPRLRDLQAQYAAFDRSVTEPLVWNPGHVRPVDIQYFRGDNAYVWQLRGRNMHATGYTLTGYYLQSIDSLDLYSKIAEDHLFGIFTFELDGRLVSRDLLDSMTEMYFLEKHLGISERKSLTCLDIGAGYGRLAHRMVTAFPNVERYLCTDGVAVSTFISEYYLRSRGVDRAEVIPLYDIERRLATEEVDLAINIHSFSECQLPAIEWWLRLLERSIVRFLMIVPNSLDHGGTSLQTNTSQDFSHIIERHGFRLAAKEPKYRDPVVQEYGIAPTYHYLFERR